MGSQVGLHLLVIYAIAAAAGASRCLRNGDFESVRHLVAVTCVSGFVGLSVVALGFGDDGGSVRDIGIAAICGLAGKEPIQFGTYLSTFIRSALNDHTKPKLDEGDR